MRLPYLLSSLVAAVAADSRRVQQPGAWQPHRPGQAPVPAHEGSLALQQRGARNTNFAQQNSYSGPPAEDSEPIDLHNKEFCVDVSTYQPVVWVEREAEECETVFVKQCGDKSENVCADVTETKCEVSSLQTQTLVGMGVESDLSGGLLHWTNARRKVSP